MEKESVDEIRLMIRDPVCCFAYWDFSRKTRQLLPEDYFLQIYSDDEWHSQIRIPKENEMDYYIYHDSPGSEIYALLGRYSGDDFIEIAKSNRIRSPKGRTTDSVSSLSGLEGKIT